MDMQVILVIILFIAAAIYLGRLLYKSLFTKKGCGNGNCKCGVDFTNIESVNHK